MLVIKIVSLWFESYGKTNVLFYQFCLRYLTDIVSIVSLQDLSFFCNLPYYACIITLIKKNCFIIFYFILGRHYVRLSYQWTSWFLLYYKLLFKFNRYLIKYYLLNSSKICLINLTNRPCIRNNWIEEYASIHTHKGSEWVF